MSFVPLMKTCGLSVGFPEDIYLLAIYFGTHISDSLGGTHLLNAFVFC